MKKKILSLIIALSMVISTFPLYATESVEAEENTAPKNSDTLVLVSTNDAHCSIDKKDNSDPNKAYIGYECVATVFNEQKSSNGTNTEMVDAGDHLQGAPIGLLTKGQDIINIMNKVGYTISAVGNHEFDVGLSRLFLLTLKSSDYADKADFPYICCNFIDLATGNPVYDPYIVKEYTLADGITKKKVAYVGVTTPETITLVAPATFSDTEGNVRYSFCQDDTGEALYNQIQKYVNEARTIGGADYVVIIGHVGQDGRPDKWRSDTIVKNITGVNAFIDGHSHEKYIQTVQDKDGKNVVISQTGSNLNAVGIMSINLNNGAVEADVKQAPIDSDSEIAAYVKQLESEFKTVLEEKVAETPFTLYAFKDDNYSWEVRTSETNLGDLITDAFKNSMNADISMIGGGGIRANITSGDITYNDALSVQPFGNNIVSIKATGQQILDALELGVMKYPQDSGAFMQVSGLTYEFADDIPSSVVVDEKGNFVKVDGTYRVRNVMVGNEALDVNKIYVVAGLEYTLHNGGDGLSMFKDCEVVNSSGIKDFDIFATYLSNLKTIGNEYSNRYGQGRIKIVKSNADSANIISGDTGANTDNNSTAVSPKTADDNVASINAYILMIMLCGFTFSCALKKKKE